MTDHQATSTGRRGVVHRGRVVPAAGTWPPPPMADAPWESRQLRVDGHADARAVTVREIYLWGQEVLIDQAHRIYCPRCRRFVPAVELAARGVHAFDRRTPRGHVYAPVMPCAPTSDGGRELEDPAEDTEQEARSAR